MKILVTGGAGFIGRALLELLVRQPAHRLVATVRQDRGGLPAKVEVRALGDISSTTDWSGALSGVDVVIHTAARAHVLHDRSLDPLPLFRAINVEAMTRLARQAGEAGVRRFILLSSIGVNGSSNCAPFTELDTPAPVEPYAISKLEAEQALMEIASESRMEYVILRPPLVYGPGAPGNFRRLMKVIWSRMPLPLGSVSNRRTFVGLGNLIDLIQVCTEHPGAANQIFLAGDAEDVSTSDLMRMIGEALGRPVWLWPMPPSLLVWGASLLGKKAMARQLVDSLSVDISKARNTLGWTPPLTLAAGLRITAEAWIAERRR